MLYQNVLLRQHKHYPLDCIVCSTSKRETARLYRQNILKNVVATILTKIREQKRKPKLRDLLKLFKGKVQNKEFILNKIVLLYANNSSLIPVEEDKKFDKLMQLFDRINKQVTYQKQTLNDLDMKVGNLQKRKEKREKKGIEFMMKLKAASDLKMRKKWNKLSVLAG